MLFIIINLDGDMMPIIITKMKSVKLVKKPWGSEKWIADGKPYFNYALKEIFLKAGSKSSLQFHRYKEESNYILIGTCLLHKSDLEIDPEKFQKQEYTDEELGVFINSVTTEKLGPGDIFHVKPKYIHRVEALTDLTMIESSTTELDDVFRLKDDTNRGHGKIDSEHS